jgi:inositol phosphorylceramide mannosyltransferase catalytic subunit
MPQLLRENVAALIARNPGWTHCLYGDEDIEEFVREQYGSAVLSQYLRIDSRYGAARADLFRYLLIYKRGGVYLDIKSSASRPLDDVVSADDRYLLSQWQNGPGAPYQGIGLHRALGHIPGGEYQQWFIVAAPGHPFLRQVILRVFENIDKYARGHFGVGRKGVVAVTGPIAYTLAIHPLIGKYPCRRIDICADAGFEYNVSGRQHEQTVAGAPVHYSRLRAPVVRLSKMRVVPWFLLLMSRKSLALSGRVLRRLLRQGDFQ